MNVDELESVPLNISYLAASKRFYGELLGSPLRHEMEGCEVAAEPEDQPWGMRTAAVLDPDGYWIGLARPSA